MATVAPITPTTDAKSAAPQPAAGKNVQACSNCGTTQDWGFASWCPTCGFYPKLGTFTELPPTRVELEREPSVWRLIPLWVYVLAAGLVAILFAGIFGGVALRYGGPWRALFALLMAGGGAIAFLVAHTAACFKAINKDDRIGPIDFIIKPVEIWRFTFTALPDAPWKVWTGSWGLASIFVGLGIVGGISYEALFESDWGFKRVAQRDVAAAIVAKASGKSDKDSLEDELDEFGNKSGAKKLKDLNDKRAKNPNAKSADCLIFGYTTDPNGDVESLLLATKVGDDLQYVGSIPATLLPDEQRNTIVNQLSRLAADQPFVRCGLSAAWLKPVLMCRISYLGQSDSGRFRRIEFDDLLMNLPEF